MLSIQQSTPRGKNMLMSIQRVNQLSVFSRHSQLTTSGLSILASSWFPKLPGTVEKHTVSPAKVSCSVFPVLFGSLVIASSFKKNQNQTMSAKLAVSNWSINGTQKYIFFVCDFFVINWLTKGRAVCPTVWVSVWMRGLLEALWSTVKVLVKRYTCRPFALHLPSFVHWSYQL